MTGSDAICHGVTFGMTPDGRFHDGNACHRDGCGSDLTAKQADGRWACPFHFDSPVQLEISL